MDSVAKVEKSIIINLKDQIIDRNIILIVLIIIGVAKRSMKGLNSEELINMYNSFLNQSCKISRFSLLKFLYIFLGKENYDKPVMSDLNLISHSSEELLENDSETVLKIFNQLNYEEVLQVISFVLNSSYFNDDNFVFRNRVDMNFHFNLIVNLAAKLLDIKDNESLFYSNKWDYPNLFTVISNKNVRITYHGLDNCLNEALFKLLFGNESLIEFSSSLSSNFGKKYNKCFFYVLPENINKKNLELISNFISQLEENTILIIPDIVLKHPNLGDIRKNFILHNLDSVVQTSTKMHGYEYSVLFFKNKVDSEIYFSSINYDKRSVSKYNEWIRENIDKLSENILQKNTEFGVKVNRNDILKYSVLTTDFYLKKHNNLKYRSEDIILDDISYYKLRITRIMEGLNGEDCLHGKEEW